MWDEAVAGLEFTSLSMGENSGDVIVGTGELGPSVGIAVGGGCR